MGTISDPSNDQGLEGPAYADLRRIVVEDDGTHARVTISVGPGLPARAAGAESLGLGVNFYTGPTERESDYQLFADGGPDGWFAYLEQPRGFVRYPGSFSVSSNAVVFVVPWSSLGGRRSGDIAAFSDWTDGSRTSALGGHASSHDNAPQLGHGSYSR